MFIEQYQTTAPDTWRFFAGVAAPSGIATDSIWSIWTAKWNGATTEIWKSGISQFSGNTGTNNPAGLTIGARAGGIFHWVGDISEILIYDPNLSTADMNQVAQYIAAKTAIVYTPIV